MQYPSNTHQEICQLAFLSEFMTDIQHVKGIDNMPADALSCIDVASSSPLLNPSELSCQQINNDELKTLCTSSSLQLQDVALPRNIIVTCDMST